MKQQFAWVLAALCLVSVVVEAGENDGEKNVVQEHEFVRKLGYEQHQVDQLVDILNEDKDLDVADVRSARLSSKYRAAMVRAVGRYLSSLHRFKNLQSTEGRAQFDEAFSNFKQLCNKIQRIHAEGLVPKSIDEEIWRKLVDKVQYVLKSIYLLPDQVYQQLTGRARG